MTFFAFSAIVRALTFASPHLLGEFRRATSTVMPNLQNAKKALRQSVVRAGRNKLMNERIDYMRRSFRKLLAEKKLDEAKKLVSELAQALDKAVGKNILKKNAAARIKSRTMAHLNKIVKK